MHSQFKGKISNVLLKQEGKEFHKCKVTEQSSFTGRAYVPKTLKFPQLLAEGKIAYIQKALDRGGVLKKKKMGKKESPFQKVYCLLIWYLLISQV